MRLRAALAMGLVTALALTACTGDEPGELEADSSSDASSQPLAPALVTLTGSSEPATVLGGETPSALAVAASEALFGAAPVVVLTSSDADPAGAATLAIELGVPLLLTPAPTPTASASSDPSQSPSAPSTTPPPGDDGSAVADELDRLGASTVVAVGGVAADFAEQLDEVTVVAAPDGADAVTDLPPGEIPELEHQGAPPRLAGLTVTGTDAVAASATVQAAGGVVHELSAPDPRTDSAVIGALADLQPSSVLGLGPAFGTAEQFASRVAVAKTGVELPGGGQVLYPYHRHVALYGNPTTAGLGSLGEQPLAESIARVTELAADYQQYTEETVVPTFELIATVASSVPSSGGDYSTEMAPDEIRDDIEAAREAGIYVVLDLQPGRSDFLTQAKLYEEFLLQPHVGLALDPEWRLEPGQVHLEQVGSVSAAEVNEVVTWLADLTRANHLPQKILVLHQFRTDMIPDRAQVDTSRDELAVLVHVDGFGPPGSKFATWNAIRSEPLPGVWWGWKNFIDEDSPTLTPEQTMDIDPMPQFVSYQ